MSTDTKLTNLVVNTLTRKQYHEADLTGHGDELFVQSDHAGVFVGANGVDALDTTNMTNCITEIPQDIKLELNNGTLTLKAGSKAYLPVGTTYSASQDVVLDNSQFGTATSNWVLAMTANNAIFPRQLGNCVSGAGATTVAGYAYDTTTNVISWYNAGGTVGGTNCSFPIAVFHTTNGTPDRIKHIFNGFGWIGTKVFSLPGLKALAPVGRNSDGTLKNTVVTMSTIKTADTYNSKYILNSAGISPASYTNYAEQEEQPSYANGQWYQPSTNTFYTISSGVLTKTTSSLYAFEIFAGTGVSAPTGIKIKQPFHAIDYNDMDLIAHQAMPSDRYIDLTLGNDNDPLTAPADGYYMLNKSSGAANERVGFLGRVSTLVYSTASSETLAAYILVSKGETVRVRFTATGATNGFRFIYANGTK